MAHRQRRVRTAALSPAPRPVVPLVVRLCAPEVYQNRIPWTEN
jgi:hypothetical protein